VYRYAADGTFIARYDAGIAPCDIFFWQKTKICPAKKYEKFWQTQLMK
jgi:hypothetical protein